eukprot:Colp12_sorted_trinity150504_noHs@24440
MMINPSASATPAGDTSNNGRPATTAPLPASSPALPAVGIPPIVAAVMDQAKENPEVEEALKLAVMAAQLIPNGDDVSDRALGKRKATDQLTDEDRHAALMHERLQASKVEYGGSSSAGTTPVASQSKSDTLSLLYSLPANPTTAVPSFVNAQHAASLLYTLGYAEEDSVVTFDPFTGTFRVEHMFIPGVERILAGKSDDASYRRTLFKRSGMVFDFAKQGVAQCVFVAGLPIDTLLTQAAQLIPAASQAHALLSEALSRLKFISELCRGNWQGEPWAVGVARIELEARRLRGLPSSPSDAMQYMFSALQKAHPASSSAHSQPSSRTGPRPRANRTWGAQCTKCNGRNHTAEQCQRKGPYSKK